MTKYKIGQVVTNTVTKETGEIRSIHHDVTPLYDNGRIHGNQYTAEYFRLPTLKETLQYLSREELRITMPTVRKITGGKYSPKAMDEAIAACKEAIKLRNRIADQKAQKDVHRIELSVEWGNSGAYGRQAQATARVQFADGSWGNFVGEKTGGCGYDKESTAISNVFNKFMLGMLWRKWARSRKDSMPYGFKVDKKYGAYFSYGVGTSSYRTMCKWMGGKWEHVHNGKHSDAWVITFPKNKPKA